MARLRQIAPAAELQSNYHVKIDVPIQLSLLSLKLGRSLRFDPAKEQIVGDSEAARLAVPKYRAPWKFPEHYLKA